LISSKNNIVLGSLPFPSFATYYSGGINLDKKIYPVISRRIKEIKFETFGFLVRLIKKVTPTPTIKAYIDNDHGAGPVNYPT